MMWFFIGFILAALACPSAHADQYGFTHPPYNYDDEYRENAWPDDGTGRRYHPGYREDRAVARHHRRRAY